MKKIIFKISGMHCASCEVLIERKLKEIAGVEKVNVNQRNMKAELYCSKKPSLDDINNAINPDGYSAHYWNMGDKSGHSEIRKNTPKDYLQIGGIFLAIAAVYYILGVFNIAPGIALSAEAGYGIIFLIGLLAAVSTCAAVIGGLLLAVTKKFNEANPGLSGIQKFKPHIYFNIGRIVSYTGFGAVIGGLGALFTLSPQLNVYFTMLISIIMLILGLQMLNLLPRFLQSSIKMPKFISHKIYDLESKNKKSAAFSLGALTFFLPCGFTQALQLYVLSVGDWQVGALTMLVFSLGTLPGLLSIGAITSFSKAAFQHYFFRFAGALIIIFALSGIGNGFALAGVNINVSSILKPQNSDTSQFAAAAPIIDGKQIINIEVSRERGIYPNLFTVKKGVPVEIVVNSEMTLFGCLAIWQIPKYNVSLLIEAGINKASFVSREAGRIVMTCGRGINQIAQINVVD
jgi:sulfite exporter TauE/SafE/copper chaperone CopZ